MVPTPTPLSLAVAQDRFVQAWSQMAGAWGIGRTMAEAHALLYISGRPMNTDDMMARLGISRGSASTTLRALLDWGLISRAHQRGDRKEYFVAEQDVWAILRTIIRERKKRELDPLVASLRELRGAHPPARAGGGSADDATGAQSRRLDAMLEFARTLDGLADRIVASAPGDLREAAAALGTAMGPTPAPLPAPREPARARPRVGARR